MVYQHYNIYCNPFNICCKKNKPMRENLTGYCYHWATVYIAAAPFNFLLSK